MTLFVHIMVITEIVANICIHNFCVIFNDVMCTTVMEVVHAETFPLKMGSSVGPACLLRNPDILHVTNDMPFYFFLTFR